MHVPSRAVLPSGFARGFTLIELLAAGTLPKRSTRSKKSMRLTRLVLALGLVLVLGVLGSVVGCGSEPQQGALAE